jgi:hypothetical protein
MRKADEDNNQLVLAIQKIMYALDNNLFDHYKKVVNLSK